MAANNQEGNTLKKRKKTTPDVKTLSDGSTSKKTKLGGSNSSKKELKENFKLSSKPRILNDPKFNKTNSGDGKNEILTKRDRRLRAKELAEARKKKRKRHYNLEQELASLWEKMRQRSIAKEEKSKLITEAIEKMKGKIPEIASSHLSSRVLQTCVKYCSQTERDAVHCELKPHFLTLACNTYAVHLVNKMLDNASKKQLADFISTLRGHVASLLRHMVGSVVVEHAYKLGNASQKQELLLELYATELQLFKDLASLKETKLLDVVSKLSLHKASVLRHMTAVIQPILEKGIVDHSILHRLLIEYLSIADKSSAAEIVQQLSSPLLVRMVHTRDGSRLGILCIKHGTAKERKKIIKGMKGHIGKIAHDQYGSLVLACIFSTVDDTKLLTKIIIRELQTVLKELVLDKHGRRPLLQLLHPNCSRYFTPDDMVSLNLSIPSLGTKGEPEADSKLESAKDQECTDKDSNMKEITMAEGKESTNPDYLHLAEGGKKDPSLRRHELLVDSGLAERLIYICTEDVPELLRSKFGKEVLYEVATGGSDDILHPTMNDKLSTLHEAIASLAAKSKSEESEEEHVLENFHSSRTIRKLVLDSSIFAATLWIKALKGKCGLWAQGHSSKVICAYLESPDDIVREMAKNELQPLIDSGVIKMPENRQPAN